MASRGSASNLKSMDKGSTVKRPAEEDAGGDKRQKISFGLSSSKQALKASTPASGFQLKFNSSKTNQVKTIENKNRNVFNDDEEEPEEMPREAKMRMRNIGRDTPTSAGPNSFGKTKQGFCNAKKVFEKTLNASLEEED